MINKGTYHSRTKQQFLENPQHTENHVWFSYMYMFYTTCLSNQTTLEDCSYVVCNSLGINFDHVQTCVEDSFGKDEAEFKKLGFEADNNILKKDA